MIKKILLAVALILPAMSMSAQKFGTVNVDEIMEALPAYAEMKTKIEASSKTYEDEFAKLQQEMEKKYTEFQQMEQTTPEAIKERRMQELQELDQKIQQFRATAQQDLQRQQMQLMQPIQESIMKAIQTVGASGNYTFIFDASQSYYAGPTVENVTPQVKSALGIK
ncbi:MAG: OmpH family outer membrane protein [Bacteroidales bacterium]|nr:OmpH family outer membrane protein [Bacteroidales bacterium]